MSGEPFRERLRRLRREEAAGAEPGRSEAEDRPPKRSAEREGERGGMPAWLKSRLERRRSQLDAPAEAEARGLAAPTGAGPPAELELRRGPEGEYALRERRFEAGYRHGEWTLDEVDAVEPGALAWLTRDRALEGIELRRAVYLDIETNGLAGGAGTYPFLIALGRFQADGAFALWQGFLRSPAEERALLAAAAAEIERAGAVVSFFGKSFDRHRLEDKMRLHGVPAPFAERPHLDLYHPCRRLYREAYEDGRLATMEAGLCGLRRGDDLPGSLAPAAWLDFLAGRAHRLEAVFQHNLDDVLSLVTLAAHLGRARLEERADGAPLGGPAAARAHGLARLARAHGQREDELSWLERTLERGARGRAVRLELADAQRLTRRSSAALAGYRALAEEAEDAHSARAWLEIAKLCEHLQKDPAAAREACARARRAAEGYLVGAARARLLRDLQGREARLARKLGDRS